MLLIVGEPIVVYQRDVFLAGPSAPWTGPWPSGSPAICAYVASRLGISVAFAGGVGDDDHGRLMRAALDEGGADTSRLVTTPDARTAWARITYRAAHRRDFEFHVEGSAATRLTGDDLGALPDPTRWYHLSGSALVFGGSLAETAITAAHRARNAGATISVDPNVRPESMTPENLERLRGVLAIADVILPSDDELEALGTDADDLLAAGATICTTLGPDGAVLRTSSASRRIAPVQVDAVDTDGAGDAFAAGYIDASLRGADPQAAAEWAVHTAAEAIRYPGPMTATFEGWAAADGSP